MADKREQRINLFYTEGSSDKEYHASLLPKGGSGGWVVDFAYGRRGSSLKTGTKTVAPIEYEAALEVYQKLVFSKVKDGYTEEQSGAVYQSPDLASRFTGLIPQLLNPIDEFSLEKALKSDDDVAQEKFDGERRSVKMENGAVVGANRTGLAVAIPVEWEAEFLKMGISSIVVDGEAMGDRYAVFDLREVNGVSWMGRKFVERHAEWERIVEAANKDKKDAWSGVFIQSPVAKTEKEKRMLFDKIKANGGEGLVFKEKDSEYVPGRPASGGSQRKFKFVESATVFVCKVHASKRSVYTAVMDGATQVDLGKVTIPVNYEIPSVNSIIEVKYLYAYKGGSLFQPVYKGVRGDQSLEDCNVSQLKFKQQPKDGVEEDEVVAAAPKQKKTK